MSKKMLKRSLALGALMAFVITGSAMAQVTEKEITNWKGTWYYHNFQGTEDTVTASKTNNDRVLGGWFVEPGQTVSEKLNSNVIVDGGTWNLVVGGNYADTGKNNEQKVILNVESTKLVVNNGNIRQLAAGTAGTDNWELEHTGAKSSTLIINGGVFGKEGIDQNAPELLVTAGDLLKDGDNETSNWKRGAVSSIVDVTTEVNGGTFNAAVIGGSSAIQYYGTTGDDLYDAEEVRLGLNTEVTNASTTINGGTFNHAIIAGGFAYGWYATSVVNNTTLNINGNTDAELNINCDVYAGGMVGNVQHDRFQTNGVNELATITKVDKAAINITGATVENIYGRNALLKNLASGNQGDWHYEADNNDYAIVNTDLSLTNVTANTIDLPKGTLTLAGNNNVENITIGEGVTDIIIASKALDDGCSLVGNGTGKLTVEGDKKTNLTITGITTGTYNIASNYTDLEAQTQKLKFDQKDELVNAEATFKDGIYQVVVTAKSGKDIAESLDVSENTGNFVENIITSDNDEATEFLDKLMESDATNAVINDTLAAVQKMGEAGGNSATAANIVKNVTGVTNDRLSFNCGHSAPHKGGHGVGLFEEGSGADIWVEYVHGKDEVEDMPSTAGASSYEGQYNGIVMGVDFKKVGKFQSGIAFNYGEGDTNSVGSAVRTHSDYDFWGVGYYGNIHNDDSNVIFDINYAQTDSDVTQSSTAGALEANPETTTWSAGVKLEKLYQNENVQIVPYTGLRYMSIDSDDYATKGGGFMYNMERQNIWLLPVGVSIKQEVVNDNGWTVSPRVDLSYIWAFGDTNSNMEVKVGNGITPIGYDVMDDGSFLGLVGIEAHKGQWGYGIAYSYQKGDHSESKKWYVDVNYSF